MPSSGYGLGITLITPQQLQLPAQEQANQILSYVG